MIRIRIGASWSSVAWLLLAATGLTAGGEEAAPPVAAPRKEAQPATPGEPVLGAAAPLPARAPAAARPGNLVPAVPVPQGQALPVLPIQAVPMMQVLPFQAVPIEARAAVPAVRLAAPFVPRKVIVDANGVQRVVPGDFDQWAYGTSGANGADVRRRNLATQLQQRIRAIDAVCNLTPTQRSRLEFAGRGDIARLFDAMTQVKYEVEAAKEDFERIEDIYRANAALRMGVLTGPFGEDSLLFKSIEPLLDPAQAARFELLRELLQSPSQFVCAENGLIDIQLRGETFDDERLLRIFRLGTPERPLRLRTVYLYQTRVTDAGLAAIPPSETLESLSVYGTVIGDAGLVNLQRFPNLLRLHVSELTLTEASFREIGKLTHLLTLNVSNSQVTDESLSHLQNLTGLASLSLLGNPIGDEGLAHLEKMTSLQSLIVSQTNVTDAGIAKLRGLTRLRTLIVRNSKVTPQGITELRKSLPNLASDISALVLPRAL